MQVTDAFVSGSIGIAICRTGGGVHILAGPTDDLRPALPNERLWLKSIAREVTPVEPMGYPTTLESVRSKLDEEIRFFNGLDGLLIGMDGDYSAATRQRGIARAEGVLTSNPTLASRIRRRFLVPVNLNEWDPEGALHLAVEIDSPQVIECYRRIVSGFIDRLANDIAEVVSLKLGNGADAARARDVFVRSGLLSELAAIANSSDQTELLKPLFHRMDFPDLQTVDPSGQILTTILNRIADRDVADAGRSSNDHDGLVATAFVEAMASESLDPIATAVEQILTKKAERGRRPLEGRFIELTNIQPEIEWIGDKLHLGQVKRAESALVQLLDRQSTRTKAADIMKTLTSVANLARKANLIDFAFRLLNAIDRLGTPDEVAMCVRGEILRDLGHFDEALAVFEDTMLRFPQDEVAPAARAETLRDLGQYEDALVTLEDMMCRFPDNVFVLNTRAETLHELGRHDEALAAFNETIRRFPQDEVAPTARAVTLRDLGRHDEALAALENTIRRFPQNEVAPCVRAETLRDLGRYEEALAALDDTIFRFPHSEIARNARAETLRDLGRHDEALMALEDAMRHFPQNEVAPTARAEVLRDLGRYEEALAALEDTMRRFPYSDVIPNARAETLRDLGRYEDALRAFEDTARRFPHNAIAFTARAETLRDLDRHEEALTALEDTMRRFPRNEIAPTAYAEVLRDLGRYEEALVTLEDTMRRFPSSDWVPNARAETLRDLGRYEDALKAFEDTARRFPHNAVASTARAGALRDLGRYDEALTAFGEVFDRFPKSDFVRNAYAHLLAQLGNIERAETLIGAAATRRLSRPDWIAAHIQAMARLRVGRIAEALADLERGSNECTFLDVRRYFDATLPLALLADKRAKEAAQKLEKISRNERLPRSELTNVILFQTHALAEAGESLHAKELIRSAQVVKFSDARQRQLAAVLLKQYSLTGGADASTERKPDLADEIAILEFELACPRLLRHRTNLVRAA